MLTFLEFCNVDVCVIHCEMSRTYNLIMSMNNNKKVQDSNEPVSVFMNGQIHGQHVHSPQGLF